MAGNLGSMRITWSDHPALKASHAFKPACVPRDSSSSASSVKRQLPVQRRVTQPLSSVPRLDHTKSQGIMVAMSGMTIGATIDVIGVSDVKRICPFAPVAGSVLITAL